MKRMCVSMSIMTLLLVAVLSVFAVVSVAFRFLYIWTAMRYLALFAVAALALTTICTSTSSS